MVVMATSNFLINSIIEEEWEMVRQQCNDHPLFVGEWSKLPFFLDWFRTVDVLPIHVACASAAPLDVVESIIDAFPAGVRARESGYRCLPLHIACRLSSPVEIVRLLLRNYPEGSGVADNMGRMPLHYAIKYKAPEAVIRLLLRYNPSAAKVYDKTGLLPIHEACQTGASPDIMLRLLMAYPGSASATTYTGISTRSIVEMGCRPHKEEIMEILEEAKAFALMKDEGIDASTKGSDSPSGRRTRPPRVERNLAVSQSVPSHIHKIKDSPKFVSDISDTPSINRSKSLDFVSDEANKYMAKEKMHRRWMSLHKEGVRDIHIVNAAVDTKDSPKEQPSRHRRWQSMHKNGIPDPDPPLLLPQLPGTSPRHLPDVEEECLIRSPCITTDRKDLGSSPEPSSPTSVTFSSDTKPPSNEQPQNPSAESCSAAQKKADARKMMHRRWQSLRREGLI